MTPTDQDKKLRERIKTIIIGFDGGNWYDEKADSIMQLITADRKRVALKARINEINYLDDNFQADSQNWEREHPGYSTAMIPMEDYIRRRTELKQELEKL